ncbi:MAG TPA: hypothetical protein VF097_03540 [Actinomycetota bacterium]
MQVEYTPLFEPPDVECALYTDRVLSEQEQEDLQTVVLEWYEREVGRYDAPIHNMSELGFDHDGLPTIEWWIDLGSANLDRLDELVHVMQGRLSSWGIEPVKLVLGRRHGP